MAMDLAVLILKPKQDFLFPNYKDRIPCIGEFIFIYGKGYKVEQVITIIVNGADNNHMVQLTVVPVPAVIQT